MEEFTSDSDGRRQPSIREKPYCCADASGARAFARASPLGFARGGYGRVDEDGGALLFGGRDVKSGRRAEPDHDLVAAAARAVLAALREPLEQRDLPRAAIGALRMLEAALEGDVGRNARR
jgi:hypothetical protein